ncbi:hypothetical protein PG985_010335 [Apiospora marii]|uniref:uncharacterized protein n=1 Tax=Apiospora marii TaxID=335849 RepID=UPI0031313218
MKFQLLNVALAACVALASALPVSDTDSPLQKRAVTISNEGSIPKQAQCGASKYLPIPFSSSKLCGRPANPSHPKQRDQVQQEGDHRSPAKRRRRHQGRHHGRRPLPLPHQGPRQPARPPLHPAEPPSPPPVPEIPDIPDIPTPPGVPGFRRSLPDDDDDAGDSLPGLAARNSKALQHFPMKNGKSAYNGGKVKDERVMYWMDKGDDSLEYAGLWTHEGAPAKGQFVKCTETF